jgi:hypothetical protein
MKDSQKETKNFFFEKKKQKTSAHWGLGDAAATTRRTKSFFASFFSKKEGLASYFPKRRPKPIG